MNILITAGNTQVPIDQVRCLTNIFTGRTGAALALAAQERGHGVTLLTSHPNIASLPDAAIEVYRTFDDLQALMARCITTGRADAVIHCAAVSDYLAGGIYAPRTGTRFDPAQRTWQATTGVPALADCAAGKIKSDEPELWLRLVRAPKLVDRIRSDWDFRGILVKFKLEVGVDEKRLLAVAERSRQQSSAELMVANTLESAAEWAWLGPLAAGYQRIGRADLPRRLLEEIEARHREKTHG